jgi:hypothetical protein
MVASTSVACGLLFADIADAQTTSIATVNGTILNTDGSRVLYAPTGQTGVVDLLNISSHTTSVISFGSSSSAQVGYLTPLGTVFGDSSQVYNYNGSTTVAYSGSSLVANGRYAAFTTYSAYVGCCVDHSFFRLDTMTGSLTQPNISGYNAAVSDVTSSGVVVGSAIETNSSSALSTIFTYDGTTTKKIYSGGGALRA